jgi:hypothetical protein
VGAASSRARKRAVIGDTVSGPKVRPAARLAYGATGRSQRSGRESNPL